MAKINLFLFLFFIGFTSVSVAQENENAAKKIWIAGSTAITNNGISLIPSFSLGKPALMFEFSMGKDKISFDPQFRFAMEGTPWSFVFWWRYKLIENQKF